MRVAIIAMNRIFVADATLFSSRGVALGVFDLRCTATVAVTYIGRVSARYSNAVRRADSRAAVQSDAVVFRVACISR